MTIPPNDPRYPWDGDDFWNCAACNKEGHGHSRGMWLGLPEKWFINFEQEDGNIYVTAVCSIECGQALDLIEEKEAGQA